MDELYLPPMDRYYGSVESTDNTVDPLHKNRLGSISVHPNPSPQILQQMAVARSAAIKAAGE